MCDRNVDQVTVDEWGHVDYAGREEELLEFVGTQIEEAFREGLPVEADKYTRFLNFLACEEDDEDTLAESVGGMSANLLFGTLNQYKMNEQKAVKAIQDGDSSIETLAEVAYWRFHVLCWGSFARLAMSEGVVEKDSKSSDTDKDMMAQAVSFSYQNSEGEES